jgi:hypothetical protein
MIGEQQVRITGQLFFDGSHHPKPCSGSLANTGDPVRATSWEIHPIYSIEICREGTTCMHANDWEPLPAFENEE